MSEARLEITPASDAVIAPAVAELSQHGHSGHHNVQAHNDNLKFAMWLFLASEVIIFTTLVATYVIYALNHPEIVKEIHEQAGVLLVTANTFLLLTSSWSMVMGLRAIRMGDQKGLVRWIGITAVLGTLFVMLQGVEYNTLSAEGITIYGSEFGMRFYTPTAVHGAHVIVGVLWALFVLFRARKGAYNQNAIGVELFGLYWHFVDVVWIFLFTVIYLI
jgi:cytochrome o ubiquinol oxidase subunit III